jgi:hypothetical protein
MTEVSADQLKSAVEAQHGCKATFVQSVPIVERAKIETKRGRVTSAREVTVWEGVVHSFDLFGHPKAKRAYAWSSELPDGKCRFYAVLRLGPVTGPVEAVRAAIVAERKASR